MIHGERDVVPLSILCGEVLYKPKNWKGLRRKPKYTLHPTQVHTVHPGTVGRVQLPIAFS